MKNILGIPGIMYCDVHNSVKSLDDYTTYRESLIFNLSIQILFVIVLYVPHFSFRLYTLRYNKQYLHCPADVPLAPHCRSKADTWHAHVDTYNYIHNTVNANLK